MLNEVLKSCKKYADVKADVKQQEIKKTGGCILQLANFL